jgi:hypothetical protein
MKAILTQNSFQMKTSFCLIALSLLLLVGTERVHAQSKKSTKGKSGKSSSAASSTSSSTSSGASSSNSSSSAAPQVAVQVKSTSSESRSSGSSELVEPQRKSSGGSSGNSISGWLIGGFGTNDAYNLGIGARVLYPLQGNPIDIGGTFAYHLGSSKESQGFKTSANAFYAVGEVGYRFPLESFVFRPYAGLGMIFGSAKTESTGGGGGFGGQSSSGSNSSSDFAFTLGSTLWIPVGSNLFFGGDSRLLFRDGSVFIISATLGMNF